MVRDDAGLDGFEGFMQLRITPVTVCRIHVGSIYSIAENLTGSGIVVRVLVSAFADGQTSNFL